MRYLFAARCSGPGLAELDFGFDVRCEVTLYVLDASYAIHE